MCDMIVSKVRLKMTRKYGTSRNAEYLANQISTLENYVSRMAGDMQINQILEKYAEIDELQTRLNSLSDPNHSDNVAEWKSRQCGEW